MSKPLTSGYARVFLIEGQARGDHKPVYMSCAKIGGLDYGLGDVEKIECPSPDQYGKFVEIGQVKGAESRPSTTLTGRYMATVESTMLRLARKGCSLDVQVHIGACQNPSVFNDFDKAIILEGVQLTNFGTDDLGALSSDENAVVNENVDLSAATLYEVLKMNFGEKAGDLVTNEVLDVVICDSVACGDCADESDGCEKIYAITKTAGGSPATIPDIVFTLDGGENWYAHDIDSVTGSSEPNALACVGDYVVIVSDAGLCLHYVAKADLNATEDPTFTKVTTGFVTSKGPRAIVSVGQKAFIVGSGGYVYSMSNDPSEGVTVLDAGLATTDNLLAVDALDENFAVAVSDDGAVIKTENGLNWTATEGRPFNATLNVALNCIAVKSIYEWWVGSSHGKLYYTTDGGKTWTEKAFSGSGYGAVNDVVFATPSIGYLAHKATTPRGRVLRTYDGGYSWKVLPEAEGASMPLADQFNAIAACSANPNFAVAVGLGDNGTDGIIVLGSN